MKDGRMEVAMSELKTALDLATWLFGQGGRDMGKTHARETLAAIPADAVEQIAGLNESLLEFDEMADEFKGAADKAEAQVKELKAVRHRLTRELEKSCAALAENVKLKAGISVEVAGIPGHVIVREAGGPEDILASLAVSVGKLKSFQSEWAEKDGNTPGYNLQKARNYGEQAARERKRVKELEAENLSLTTALQYAND